MGFITLSAVALMLVDGLAKCRCEIFKCAVVVLM